MATVKMSQKEYLRKYLSDDKSSSKKKKKKKNYKFGAKTVKIIDDDHNADTAKMRPLEEGEFDILNNTEDAPLIVGVVDERGPVDFADKARWKIIADDGEGNVTCQRDALGSQASSRHYDNKDIAPPRKMKNGTASESPPPLHRGSSQHKKSSRHRDERNLESSPPRRTKKHPSRHPSSESDQSSPRRKKNDEENSDIDPPRRRKKEEDSDIDPPRKRGRKTEEEDSDIDPPRRKTRRDEEDEDIDPPRRKSKRDEENSDTDLQRRRRRKKKDEKDSDIDPPRRRRKKDEEDSDIDPPRRRNRKDSDSDIDPPRRKNRKDSDSDIDPPRRKNRKERDSDIDPPRRRNRKDENSDIDSSRRNKRKDSDSDIDPPRRNKRKDSSSDIDPPRRNKRKDSDSDIDPPRRDDRYRRRPRDEEPRRVDKSVRRSRWNDDTGSQEPESPEARVRDSRMKKTLDGKTAGLQDARALKIETEEHKKREADLFKRMSAEVSGHGQAAVLRDRRTGRKRDLTAEAAERREKEERQAEIDEKYAKWGRGLKQMDEQAEKRQRDLYEMSKPLARYANDADLDRELREAEREGDTMLEEIKKRQIKEGKRKADVPINYHQSCDAPNRFGIKPGHRWDGVDRSNGYEKKWFEARNARTALAEEAYKWSTADM